jgi:hypothetical protein
MSFTFTPAAVTPATATSAISATSNAYEDDFEKLRRDGYM